MKYNYYFTAEDIDAYGEDVLDNCIPIGTTIVDDNGDIIKVDNLEPNDPGFKDALGNLSRFPSMTLLG
jgi:hypothetical protein